MTAVVGLEAMCAVQVVVGVDTHQDEHVAVAIDQQGVRLAERHAPAGSYGYRELERWSQKLGEVRAFGVRVHWFIRRRTCPIPDQSRLYRRRGQPA